MNINKVLSEFKEGIINSKKYWIIYLAFILIAALSIMNIENFMNPKLEIITILILSLSGILCISHFHIHKSDKELYKTAFIIILIINSAKSPANVGLPFWSLTTLISSLEFIKFVIV